MESVYKEYVSRYEILIDTLLMCGITADEANVMVEKFEMTVKESIELSRKGGDPLSNKVVGAKSKKGGIGIDGNS